MKTPHELGQSIRNRVIPILNKKAVLRRRLPGQVTVEPGDSLVKGLLERWCAWPPRKYPLVRAFGEKGAVGPLTDSFRYSAEEFLPFCQRQMDIGLGLFEVGLHRLKAAHSIEGSSLEEHRFANFSDRAFPLGATEGGEVSNLLLVGITTVQPGGVDLCMLL